MRDTRPKSQARTRAENALSRRHACPRNEHSAGPLKFALQAAWLFAFTPNGQFCCGATSSPSHARTGILPPTPNFSLTNINLLPQAPFRAGRSPRCH
jgi:hypothetical protein